MRAPDCLWTADDIAALVEERDDLATTVAELRERIEAMSHAIEEAA